MSEVPGVTEVEQRGIEEIPDAERTVRPLDLFRVELGGAHFGVVGRIVGSFLSLLTAVTFFAISVYTSGDILVGALDDLAGTGQPEWLLAIVYAVFAGLVLVVCLYGFRFLLAVNKVAVVLATLLYVVGAVLLAMSKSPTGAAGLGEPAELRRLPRRLGALHPARRPLRGWPGRRHARLVPAARLRHRGDRRAVDRLHVPVRDGAGLLQPRAALQAVPLDRDRRGAGHHDRLRRAVPARRRDGDHDVRDADHRLHDAVGGDHDRRLRDPPRLLPARRRAGVQPRRTRRAVLVSPGLQLARPRGLAAGGDAGPADRQPAGAVRGAAAQRGRRPGIRAAGGRRRLPGRRDRRGARALRRGAARLPEPRGVYGERGPRFVRAKDEPVAEVTG